MGTEKNIHYWLGIFNDFLMIPMLTFIIFDVTEPTPHPNREIVNLFFSASFFSEWAVGLWKTKERKSYLLSIEKIIDFISCLPIGSLTKSLRLVRLFKIIRILRVITRAKRYQGPNENFFRLITLLGVTIFTGGYSIIVVEPDHPDIHNFADALWWSMVTISTVGYGDIVPETPMGRTVAAMLIAVGLGVCGYLAAFASSLIQDDPTVSINDLEEKISRLEKKMDLLLANQKIDSLNTKNIETAVDETEEMLQNIKDPNSDVL